MKKGIPAEAYAAYKLKKYVTFTTAGYGYSVNAGPMAEAYICKRPSP